MGNASTLIRGNLPGESSLQGTVRYQDPSNQKQIGSWPHDRPNCMAQSDTTDRPIAALRRCKSGRAIKPGHGCARRIGPGGHGIARERVRVNATAIRASRGRPPTGMDICGPHHANGSFFGGEISCRDSLCPFIPSAPGNPDHASAWVSIAFTNTLVDGLGLQHANLTGCSQHTGRIARTGG